MATDRMRRNRGREPFWPKLDELKGRIESGQVDREEILDLVEAFENRLAFIEEDNRSFQAFFDDLVQVLGDTLEKEEIRALIQKIGLRQIFLKAGEPEKGAVH